MSRIERDVERLMPAQDSWSLLDGLLLGAVVGAAGAALVIVGQVVATRRLARRLKGPGGRPRPAGEGSPL